MIQYGAGEDKFGGSIISDLGRIISNDRVTTDGIQVIEVQFADGVRNYSGNHLQEASQ